MSALARALHSSANRIRARRFGVVIAFVLLLSEALAAAAVAVARPVIAPAAPTTSTQAAAYAGPKNIVQAVNNTDGHLRVFSRMQLGRVPAPQAGPVNVAEAINTCTRSCDTLAVAFQINLVSENAAVVAPQNDAVALNSGFGGCHAVALAIQYNIGAPDPPQVPPDVYRMAAAMKAELARIDSSSMSLTQAETEIDGVLAQYPDLAAFRQVRRDEALSPA